MTPCPSGHDFQAQYLNTAVWFVCRRCGYNFQANIANAHNSEHSAPHQVNAHDSEQIISETVSTSEYQKLAAENTLLKWDLNYLLALLDKS